jgi:hypothetical protein
VAGSNGCRVASTNTIVASVGLGSGTGASEASYPPCSPYVSETTSSICTFYEMRLVLDRGDCRVFGDSARTCTGQATSGPFPWGATLFGGNVNPWVEFSWDGAVRRSVTFSANDPDVRNPGVGRLAGSVPSSSSPDFTVDDGFAQNDLGYPNGDHFFTPDIPGQSAGEVGGPLYLNYVNGGVGEVYIHGYLYLKR